MLRATTLAAAVLLAACGGGTPTSTPSDEPTTPVEGTSPTTQPTNGPTTTPEQGTTTTFDVTLTGTSIDGTYELGTDSVTGCTVGLISAGHFYAQYEDAEAPLQYIELSIPDFNTASSSGSTTEFTLNIKREPSTVPHVSIDTFPNSSSPGGSGTAALQGDGNYLQITIDGTAKEGGEVAAVVTCNELASY